MTVAYNTANSLALLFIGFLLDLVKFNPEQPVQALSVQNGLGIIVFVGCALSIALSILFFSKYNLKRTDLLKAQMNYEKQMQILGNVRQTKQKSTKAHTKQTQHIIEQNTN
jgi:Na+/melibiose symporter-like transporter